MKKIILATVALLMLMALFSSCAKKPEDQPPEPTDWISLSEISDYKIVLPKHANAAMKKHAETLKRYIIAATGIADISIVDKSEGGENEILLGDTGSSASNEFHKELRYNDCAYSVSNKTIIIAGYSSESVSGSVEKFKAEVLDKIDTASGIFARYGEAVQKASYKSENMTVGGIPAKGLKVIYNADADSAIVSNAVSLAKRLSEKSGYGVVARSSEEYTDSDNILYYGAKEDFGPKEAVRGLSLPEALGEKDMYIARNANTIIYAFDHSSRETAYTKLGELISNITDNDISLPAKKIYSYVGIMSFNIYVGQQQDPQSHERVIEMINKYKPDTFGVQEAGSHWMAALKAGLPDYDYVGDGREGGTSGEHNAVFYLKDKYKVTETGTKWMSSTPDYPSRFEPSPYNRIYTYAYIFNKQTNTEYLHINTHFDHTNDDIRTKQAEVLAAAIEEFSEQDIPIVVTGDFNCYKDTTPYETLIATGIKNSSEIAKTATDSGTYHAYKNYTNRVIDFCFVNSGFDVLTYKVCNEKINGEFASDHHPVFIEAYY